MLCTVFIHYIPPLVFFGHQSKWEMGQMRYPQLPRPQTVRPQHGQLAAHRRGGRGRGDCACCSYHVPHAPCASDVPAPAPAPAPAAMGGQQAAIRRASRITHHAARCFEGGLAVIGHYTGIGTGKCAVLLVLRYKGPFPVQQLPPSPVCLRTGGAWALCVVISARAH